MTYLFNAPTDLQGISVAAQGTEVLWHLKEALVRAGWVVTASGDGTSYNASGDLHATIASFTGNTRAWFAIQDPGGGRAFTFQRVSNAASVRIKYALTGGFTAGSPGASTTPEGTTAGEEQIITGSGTDASPTGTTFGSVTGSTLYMLADDEAPYGFAAFAKTASSEQCGFFMDPLADGSYSITDLDPVVIGWNDALGGYSTAAPASGTTEGPRAWFRKASGSGAFQGCGYLSSSGWGQNSVIVPKAAGTDPESGDEVLAPVIWGRSTALSSPNGWKGVSSLFNLVYSARTSGETAGGETKVVVNNGELYMPWNGTTPIT